MLNYLYNAESVEIYDYLNYLEILAKRFVFDRFLAKKEGKSYFDMIFSDADVWPDSQTEKYVISKRKIRYGSIENNFIFNYLDYLIWCRDRYSGDPVIESFGFSFRSSVEHFSPQHPMDGHKALGSGTLHSFGNLCLISHSKNSSLSNRQPKSKQEHFQAGIKQNKVESLKLYLMLKVLDGGGKWCREQVRDHGRAMRSLLLEAYKNTNRLHAVDG